MRWLSTTQLHGSFNALSGFAFGGAVEPADELAALNLGIFGGRKGLSDSAQYALATEHFEGLATATVFGVDFADDRGGLGFAWESAAADLHVVGGDHCLY